MKKHTYDFGDDFIVTIPFNGVKEGLLKGASKDRFLIECEDGSIADEGFSFRMPAETYSNDIETSYVIGKIRGILIGAFCALIGFTISALIDENLDKIKKARDTIKSKLTKNKG